jgi:hypothetical protein
MPDSGVDMRVLLAGVAHVVVMYGGLRPCLVFAWVSSLNI